MSSSGSSSSKRKKGEGSSSSSSSRGSSDAYCLIYYRKGEGLPKEADLDPPEEVKVRRAVHTHVRMRCCGLWEACIMRLWV
jgi:hypothetical protein